MADQTIGEFIRALFPKNRIPPKFLSWPPDVFAVTATILQNSGAYCKAVGDLGLAKSRTKHALQLQTLGENWRKSILKRSDIPVKITLSWECIKKNSKTKLRDTASNSKLLGAILDLLSAADEACKDIAYPTPIDEFHDQVWEVLMLKSNTLCKWILPFQARVLPKGHTPQVGMTLRSLSHNLALCGDAQVGATWYPIEANLATESNDAKLVNLLVIPYPFAETSSHYVVAADTTCGRTLLPDQFGFFNYNTPSAKTWISNEFEALLKKALSEKKEIHGIIMPEGSLPSKVEFHSAYSLVQKYFPQAFFLAGICEPGTKLKKFGKNYLQYAVPIPVLPGHTALFSQSKHHRWQLDAAQIKRYNLDNLDRGRKWWEKCEISDRSVAFFSAKHWLSFCFLICEDLARQEPVAPVLRAIGPHLVVALLQDGPQMPNRWSNRYAGVLADDPGSAVLTVTSLGMLLNSKTPPKEWHVAMFKDRYQLRPLTLKKGCTGIILNLRSERVTEYSADGRENCCASALVYEKHLCI